MKMQKEIKIFGNRPTSPQKMSQLCRRAAAKKKGKVLIPRSSSPRPVFADNMPCIVEQAFATIAWDDLSDCASVMRREGDSLGSQVNESDGDEHDFGEYALEFMADSPGTLESSLSPAGLVPFQGCIIPPLTPRQDFSPENSLTSPSPDAGNHHAQNGGLWRGMANYQGWVLDNSIQVNHQLHKSLHRRQEEIDFLQERNVHLRELANRAKHLASVLDKLMTARDPCPLERSVRPSCEITSNVTNPCKRQRLNEEFETETASSGSVEDILRDISTRCNAVLHSGAKGSSSSQDSDNIRMYGAFSGLQTSIAKVNSMNLDGSEGSEDFAFRTSIKEHGTIKTKVFPHGHAFTSRTEEGGYRFRWVPNQS